MYTLEEFPPPPRKRSNNLTTKTAKPARPRSERTWGRYAAGVVIAATVAGGTWFWMDRRMSAIEDRLTGVARSVEDAGASLRLLWTTTTKLDESQVARQDVLQDSIGFVRQFVESEVNKLWNTAYLDHERRLGQSEGRLRNNDQAIRQLATATGSTNTRLDVLMSQNRSLEENLRLVSATAAGLRQSLLTLTGQLSELQGQLTSARTTQTQMANRVEGVERWVAEFREEDLDAETVRERLTSLVTDLRTMSMRVDSLLSRTDTVRSARPR
jgi:chromosome segregation ATPase